MFKRSHYIALALVGLLTLIVLNLPHHTANQIKLAFGSLFLPLFGFSRTSQEMLARTADATLSRSELLDQNRLLTKQNAELQIRSLQLEPLQRENDRLRQMLGWQRQSAWQLHPATVLSRDPANWWRGVQIDIGSHDGVKLDMPVITGDGLVGRISAVSFATAQVTLIGSQDCKVAAIVERSGENGIINGGASSIDFSLVTLSFLPSGSNLKPGQRVITSGEGRIFPKGILVGLVAEESRQVEMGYNEAKVKLAANIGALEEVWVIMR